MAGELATQNMVQVEEKVIFDAVQIQNILLHRYPFLLVDKVIGFDKGKSIRAIKNVTASEYYFEGHFPGAPVMPGVLIMEAMAQTAAILLKMSVFENSPAGEILLVGATDFKWKRKVLPGDTLVIDVAFTRFRKPLWHVVAEARVDGKIAAKGQLSAMAPGLVEAS